MIIFIVITDDPLNFWVSVVMTPLPILIGFIGVFSVYFFGSLAKCILICLEMKNPSKSVCQTG